MTASVDCFAANLIVSKYLCLVLTMEIYFNHNCFVLLLPRGSHSIVGPARVALKRVNHNQYRWMPNKLLNVYFGARMNPATGSGDG